jgi:phosphoribosylformimino-5-aminoimidazole carboxamide ribotide isomerase
MAVARAYRQLPGVSRCYVADLEAIAGQPPQRELLHRLQSADGFGGPFLLDAGVHSLATLERLPDGLGDVVVGLETLRSFTDLEQVARHASVAFSLDLRHGVPLAREDLLDGSDPGPVALARAAVAAGAQSVILLDVGRVGHGAGVDLELLATLRQALPGIRLLAGGGVRDDAGLDALERHGCDGALIATALHRGTLAFRAPGARQPGRSEVR